ncbi:hypothetical protein EJ05DRAFT_445189 [Pseudovirgaria hyperparasitica]|uniref:Rhamnogalacturonate lyase n=1 Tax=Pseudovirgaria hyperparasitica TaxID=470096 RepID=A0A6A6VVC2_9PEZI|nr:uncharacterized protein EJ05DRAFT_445189 [Pseudovirgaria hyperparasitica]KAF2753217.1 hypothetical protein EJ05DRAFT_445189 [Pseudovirgaria hyperparasitica]
MLVSLLFLALLAFITTVSAAFGITTSSASYVIDAGSANPLVVTISRASCDITSIKYRGTEVQYQSTGSHIGSGLGTATVSATIINSQYAKVTCVTSTLTHYYVVQSGGSTVWMATYITAEPTVGELRYIARLNNAVYPTSYPFGDASTTKDGTAIEGSDIFSVSGQTRSKFYSSQRFIDDGVHCVEGNDAHACFLTPQYESSSGGPFFRDIDANNGGAYTSLTFYMNSGHVQTESYRMGLHGPYALTFSRSGIPAALKVSDTAFFASLGIKGYVAASGRGFVKGTVSGAGTGERVVHWYNANAQYWVKAASSGAFTSPAMKPGTYTQVLYQVELKVASTSVSVSAGATVTKDIASTATSRNTIWTIGAWDGQPTGFRNAANQLRMHPSDSRMSSWSPGTYTVGSSALSAFPMALWKSVNNGQKIAFTLTSAQTGAATLRIGTTLSFAGARPQAIVNSWTGPAPAAPTKIDSRGVTRGAYRGYGEVYDVSIPSGTLVAGSNTITINVVSGSDGDTYLSPNIIFDAIELFK